MNRYSPNPRLVAPSTELRMVEDAQGEYVELVELLQLSREELDDLLLELLREKQNESD